MKTLVQRMPVPTRVPIAGNRGGNASTQMELSARQPKFENASTAGYESVVSTQPEDEGYPVRDGTGYASGYYTQPEETEVDPNGQSKDMAVAFPNTVGVQNAYPSSDWLKGYTHSEVPIKCEPIQTRIAGPMETTYSKEVMVSSNVGGIDRQGKKVCDCW
jgi:hypothetical protein